jgi:hypothetical protein
MKRERLFLSRCRFIGTAPEGAEITTGKQCVKYLLKCGEIVGKISDVDRKQCRLIYKKGDISKKPERVTFQFNANIAILYLIRIIITLSQLIVIRMIFHFFIPLALFIPDHRRVEVFSILALEKSDGLVRSPYR